MSGEWTFTRQAMRAAVEVFERIPAEIADGVVVSASPTGIVTFQVDRDLSLGDRVNHVTQIAALFGAEPEWGELTNAPDIWSFKARRTVGEWIEVEVFTHTHAGELASVRPDLVPDRVGVAG